jgi:hypothetical protein
MNDDKPTLNSDGTPRKLRENEESNFKWTEEFSTIAFYCFKAKPNTNTKIKISEKLGTTLSKLNSRINEFQTYQKSGEGEDGPKMTVLVFAKNKHRTAEDCERKLDKHLGLDIGFSEDNDCDNIVPSVTFSLEEIVKDSSLVQLIKTKDIIDQIISTGVVDFNGKFINATNLVLLQNVKSLEFIESSMEGCYFIFSDLPKEKIPVLSKDGFKCHELSIEKDGTHFRCLYNGKGNSVKERLKVHLFNSHTLEKIKQGKAKTISGTGAMSLVSLPKDAFDVLEREGKYIPSKHNLKPVEKSIQDCAIDKREGHQFFLNGIDIKEDPWSGYKFAVIVLKSDSEFGKILIEEAFCEKNGRPPLCRRHG